MVNHGRFRGTSILRNTHLLFNPPEKMERPSSAVWMSTSPMNLWWFTRSMCSVKNRVGFLTLVNLFWLCSVRTSNPMFFKKKNAMEHRKYFNSRRVSAENGDMQKWSRWDEQIWICQRPFVICVKARVSQWILHRFICDQLISIQKYVYRWCSCVSVNLLMPMQTRKCVCESLYSHASCHDLNTCFRWK